MTRVMQDWFLEPSGSCLCSYCNNGEENPVDLPSSEKVKVENSIQASSLVLGPSIAYSQADEKELSGQTRCTPSSLSKHLRSFAT